MSAPNYDAIYQAAGKEWDIDPRLLKAMATQESGGNPNAVSKANAQGVMQIIPSTQRMLGVTNPNDPWQSIFAGAKYMDQALTAEKTPEDALRFYHGGPDWRSAYGSESAGYAPAISAIYQKLAPLDVPPDAAPPAAAAPADALPEPPIPPAPFAQPGDTVPGTFDEKTPAVSPYQMPAAPSPTATGSPPVAAVKQDDTDAFLTGASPAAPPPAAAAAPAPTPAAGPDATDAFLSGAGEAPSPTAASTPAAVAEPSTLQKIGAGLSRAAHDMTDVPAEYLAKGADAIGLTNLLNRAGVTAPSAPQTAAADQSGLADYNKNYGDSTIASAARIGGQIAGTVPLLASGGGVAGAAGEVGTAAATRLAPWLGKAAEGVSSLLDGSLTASTPAANLLTRGASLATRGALEGGAAGVLTAGQSDQSIGHQAATGALAGGLLGPVAGAAGAGVNALLGRNGGIAPEVAQLAQLARDKYNIPIPAPQMSGSSLVRIANAQSSALPFSGAAASQAATQSAWQKAVINQMGETAPVATPEVMSNAAKRIGGVFNDVAKRTQIAIDDPALEALTGIQSEAGQAPLGAGGHEAISAQIDNIMSAAASGNGKISGDAYQQLTRAGSPLQRAQAAGDPNVRFYAGQVREALDSAFQRSAAPEDQAALGQARGQWRAMKTIEDMVEKSPDGNLSPALLMGQVRGASSRFDGSTSGMAYTGGGPLGELARIGQQFMKPQPNSGTPDRLLVNSLLGGGAVAGAVANPLSLAAVPAGLAANRLAGGYLRSGGYAGRMINSSLNPLAAGALPGVGAAGGLGYNALNR